MFTAYASGAGLYCSTNGFNSPFWNISSMISLPPINSPFTHNCGKVPKKSLGAIDKDFSCINVSLSFQSTQVFAYITFSTTTNDRLSLL